MLQSRFATYSDRPVANRIFTNRERPIALFDAARADLPPDRHRLLVFYGVGGQGKTALCRHLRRRLADENQHGRRWGHLDLTEPQWHEPARGLLQLRLSLRASGSIRCTLFDVAIARYWERAYPTEDIELAFKDLLGDHEGILGAIADNTRDWLDLAEELPAGLGLGLKSLNLARRWLKERGAKQACDALRGLEQIDSVQLLDRLPYFLGLDLQAHRQAGGERTPNPAPILFIDTYEAL